ncbi:hypothetical protein AB0J14_04750 [Micromonospora arborensis]|uniref:hypothetical protein n=1 Tax=Micromonospora arborensis TaxID=2116518 RepID=UPI0033FD65C4
MRYRFGGTVADYAITLGDAVSVPGMPGAVTKGAVIVGGATITAWNAREGGTRYTDLRTVAGAPVDSILTSTGADLGSFPEFDGPEGVRWLYASGNGGPRVLLVGRVDAVDRNGDSMVGVLVLADGSPAASQAYALPKSGGTLTGALTLSGAPTAPLHAATKGYVDSLGGGGGGSVASVNGKTGVVVLTTSDVGAAPTSHTHTTSQVTGLDTALAGKAAVSHDHTNRAAAWRHNGSTYVAATDAGIYSGPVDPVTLGLTPPDGSVWFDTSGG